MTTHSTQTKPADQLELNLRARRAPSSTTLALPKRSTWESFVIEAMLLLCASSRLTLSVTDQHLHVATHLVYLSVHVYMWLSVHVAGHLVYLSVPTHF